MFRPNREFQAGLNCESSRRQRQSQSLSLRRKDREKTLQNKRKKILTQSQSVQGSGSSPSSDPINDQQRHNELLQQLPRFIAGCYQNNKAVIFECVQNIRKLLSFTHNVPIQQVIDNNVIPRIMQFLQWNDCNPLKFEVMWILTNIASSDKPEDIAKIIKDGAIGVFVDLLNSPSYPLQEQAVWALGNISGENKELKDMILRQNVLPNLLKICQSIYSHQYYGEYNKSEDFDDDINAKKQWLSLLNNTSWSISNLCRGGVNNELHLNKILQCLWCLIKQYNQLRDGEGIDIGNYGDDDHILQIGKNICWSFDYLTKEIKWEFRDIAFMNNNQFIAELIQLLDAKNAYNIREIAIKAVGNILTGDDIHTQICINNGLLKYLYEMLKECHLSSLPRPGLKEICWALSNITAGSKQQILAVGEQNIFPILINILENGRFVVSKEAMWALANATSSGYGEIMNYLIKNGLIKAICMFFRNHFNNNQYNNNSGHRTLVASLELVENILIMDGNNSNRLKDEFEINDGVYFLEFLQTDDNIPQFVYDKAVEIVTKYYGGTVEDEFNDNIDKIESYHDDQHQNQFGFGLKENVNTNSFNF